MVTDEAGGDIRKRGWAKDVTLQTDIRLLSLTSTDNTKPRLTQFPEKLSKTEDSLRKRNWASKEDLSGFFKTLISPPDKKRLN